jgi:uncharacterized BrkB/YihY/UPF0761 family membrane protein
MIDYAQFSWIVHGVGILFFLWVLHKFFHLDITQISRILAKEFTDLLARKKSVGAYHMLGAIILFLFGIVVIVALKFEHAFNLLVGLIGQEKTGELQHTASIDAFFYVLAAWLALSIAFTFVDANRRR